jgi:NAD(P)-dependent dehydrogenase (short-subunit alcohol dehydrogenase family)
MRLAGRRALITGASQGLGLAVARRFVEEGADVMLCARNADRLDRAREELLRLAGQRSRVLAMPADVARPDDVRRLVGLAMDQLGGLEALVANAGIQGPTGPVQDVPWVAWRQAIEINLLGPVLCCREVVPHFVERKHGKIVLLSGGGATAPKPYFSAYAASKAAVVRFGETLAEELRGTGIDVNAVAPGALNTRMLDEVLEAGPARVGRQVYEQAVRQQAAGGASLERGAALCVFLASAESNGITGKLISAVWDPWERLPEHRDQLGGSDVYTLRRIVPGDRGMDWA